MFIPAIKPYLRALDSATRYPSIPTYHKLDPKGGSLTEERNVTFDGPVIATEKVDGTNTRIILLGGSYYLIGSRTELLYGRGDMIHNPALGIVDAVRDIAEAAIREKLTPSPKVNVLFGEVYGHKVTGAAKQYTNTGKVGFRLFDIMTMDTNEFMELLTRPVQQIAAWRDAGGQTFVSETVLRAWTATPPGFTLTPRRFEVESDELPTDVAGMAEWLTMRATTTTAGLDDNLPGRAEGLVLRTADRSVIAKVRHEDYRRTLKRRNG